MMMWARMVMLGPCQRPSWCQRPAFRSSVHMEVRLDFQLDFNRLDFSARFLVDFQGGRKKKVPDTMMKSSPRPVLAKIYLPTSKNGSK